MLAIATALLFAPVVHGEAFIWRGQTITYTGADLKWSDPANPGADASEPILVFKTDGSFTTLVPIEARGLIVGGGGAGGYGTVTPMNPGGGGGGGEVKKLDNKTYGAGTFTAIVGAGGAQTTTQKNGEDGHPSSFTAEGKTTTALGGGGGGSQKAGNGGETVATGGGGGGSGKLGGVGTLGEDHKGGKATATNRSGGGGGAGSFGRDSTATKGGDGGAGVESDIWPNDDKSDRAFGGGGGGGQSANATASGAGSGVAGGGNGGCQNTAPEPGLPNTGGGGGGGGWSVAAHASKAFCGAAGGSGVVIIRITFIEQPMVWKSVDIRDASGHTGKIWIDENATATTIGNEVVITYLNTSKRGGLRFYDPDVANQDPIWAQARILAVGGGGGGGFVNVQKNGGGGGGGAGGFLEESGILFSTNHEYTIAVGAGGKGGSTNDEAGDNGDDSFVRQKDDDALVMSDVAHGGGGGGAESNGKAGGSGGGGSRMPGQEPTLGGEGTSGQGFAGGSSGGGNLRGAGGGGAGEKGGDSTASSPGAGGKGKSSNITGNSIMYAGGGGGARLNPDSGSTNPGGAGGEGGGGAGAGNGAAKSGDPNTGGGGGGGAAYAGATEPAGNGGSGIVIIRLSNFVIGTVKVPVAPAAFTYDGNAHTGLVEFFAYTLSGTPVATNADVYVAHATIAEDAPYTWTGGGRGPKTVVWRINQLKVDVPGAYTNFVYNGKVQTPVDKVKFHVDADDYAWVTNNQPGAQGKMLKYCHLDDDGENIGYERTDVGDYTVQATLFKEDQEIEGLPATNFVWKVIPPKDPQTYKWHITQAPNEIRNFYYTGYRWPDRIKAHHPADQFDAAWGRETTITEFRVDNGDGTYGEWQDWGTDGPAANGNYEVRVTIPEHKNWQGAVASLPFGAWEKWSDIYTDRMEITVSGNSSGATELKDFPVPVRIHAPANDGYEAFSGFDYVRAGATGKEIRFFDQNGDPVEHDVDTWTTRGESLVWVRVPSLKNTTTKLMMCWRRVNGIRLPDYDGAGVWRDYAGVWHMSKPVGGHFIDASGHELDAVTQGGAAVELVEGKFGKGAYVSAGNVVVPGYNELNNTTNFMFSGWYRNDKSTGGNFNFVGTKMGKAWDYSPGWGIHVSSATKASAASGKTGDTGYELGSGFATAFQHLAYVVPAGSSKNYSYYNGGNVKNSSGDISTNSLPLQLVGTKFSCDEARLRKAAPANYAAWAKEEYNSLNNANYCTYGLVIREEQLCDYWVTTPSITPQVSKVGGNMPQVVFGKYSSVAGGGATAVTGTYRLMPDGEWLPMPIPAGITKGYYQAMFDHTSLSGKVNNVWYEYRPQPHRTDFYFIDPTTPTHDLGGDGGDSGRILLMNADTKATYPVKNQGWCAQSPVGTVTDGVTCWWMTAGDAGDGTNNIMGGTSFELVRCSDTNVLWTLTDCRQGNIFPTNDTQTINATPWNSYCYLPKSESTALSITNEDVAATRGSTGWAMMRNSLDACIASGCFTNGIGTIYFDAVNSRKSVAGNADGYHLVLEIADEPAEGADPVWQRVMMSSTEIQGSTYKDPVETDELALKMGTGGKDNYFYRVHVPLVKYGPVRFRIRRTTVDVTEGVGVDDGFILVDNIIVSVPPVAATLEPYGRFDPDLAGDAAVGFGGAFAVPFPSAGGPRFPGRCKVTLPPGTKYAGKPISDYISMAQMFYRWRYLGQAEDWRMAVLEGVGTDAMATAANLEFPDRPGDLEFYFVSMMKTDFYEWTDYSGLNGRVMKNGYTEEITKNDSVMDLARYKVTRLASGGTDYFTRIRDGASDWEGMTLEVCGKAFTNDCPMRLMEDGGWRGLFPIPTNVTGTCTFRFHGRNRQTAGATDYAFNTTAFGGGAAAVELPRNGILTAGGAATPFEIDHVSNYLEFRLGADGSATPTWSASRAEYQNFNNWNDVWSSAESQAFATGTNGVDDVAMTTEGLDLGNWPLYAFADPRWNEIFDLSNSDDPGYPKEKFFQNHVTPSTWNGYNVTFVSKNLVSWENSSKAAYGGGSGMAVKLKGQGGGILEYNKSTNPKGIEAITFTARVGQSIGFDDISYAADLSRKQNYTFVCPVSMSRSVAKDNVLGDMSVGGAISLFAYYRESKGAYEFRVTRTAAASKDTDPPEVLMELFKWHPVNGAMEQTRLCGQRFNFASADSLRLWNSSGEVAPKYFGLFISVKSTASGTEIYGGLGKNEQPVVDDTMTFSGGQAADGYGGLYFLDNAADKLTSGSYGCAAKDCPAQFVRPRHYDWAVDTAEKGSDKPSGLADTATYAGGKYFKPSGNKNFRFATDTTSPTFDYADIADGFWELGQQIEAWGAGKGLRTPLGLTQDVVVMLQSKDGGDWFEHKRIPVSGYTFAEKTVPVHLTGGFNIRLTTGARAVDAVIGEVRQRQWQGIDDANLSYALDDFTYTQGVVESNDLRQAREVLLQPSRGVVSKPLSVRSPVLDGLGKISFSYEDADANAEIWVQVATNNVDYSMAGETGYNLSVNSVDLADTRAGTPAPPGTWITVAKFGASADCPDGPLGRSGVRTVYLGWHDQAREPVRGIFRVFIPVKTVETALVLATNATQNVDYGRIAVTGMTVTDEPGVSERSWRGWNLRTVGDDVDAEGRMLLDDGLLAGDIGHGLTCALNNSVNDLRDDDTETAARNNPTIWSPTLEQVGGKSRSIGSVTFKARLYHPGDGRETETGGVVSLYGATSSVSENWTKLVDIPVTSSTFSNFTWTALGQTRYRAIKLEVSGREAKTRIPDRDRVIVDEISLTEKLDAKIGFEYVRPFRTNLYEPVVIEDIESPNEQPIVGESWGVQTKLRLEQLGKEVRGLEVYLATFTGDAPWGYEQWKTRAAEPIRLVPVGDPEDGIFRSVGDTPESLVPAVMTPDVVQYMVVLKYAGEGEETAVQHVEKEDWAQPEWYWPVDLNEKYGGNDDPDKFSPYTILDTVSPGRAWINEVNWNDGSPAETHTEETVVTNQFIEVCVPSGTDMTGWYLRATDLNLNKWVMAKFGTDGVRSSKVSEHAVDNFEFMLLESPETNLAGGIRDADGNPVETDGTWSIAGISSTAEKGTLAFNRPWQFELVRPSGVIEHQVVIGGTNTLSKKSYGYMYDATNLLANLNEADPSPRRFLSGDDLSRTADGRKFASIGVIGGTADGNPAPGADGTWTAPMKFTPGRLNEGQEIPAGWYLAPNGTNAWVTLTVVGEFLTQELGGESAKVMKFVLPRGVETNITYRTKPWYEVERLTVDGETVAEHQARFGEAWTYTLTPTGQFCNVVATEAFDSGLDAFGLKGHPYAPAVTRWLSDKYAEARAEDIQLALWKDGEDGPKPLDLVSMYWLDIPPIPETDEEKANAAAGVTNWWLRSCIFGGNAGWRPNSVTRVAHYAAGDIEFVNSQIDIQLYVSNAVTAKAHAPAYLQGIDYERSDTFTGTWKSETFQLVGMLFNYKPMNDGFLPFRCFVFDSGSFGNPLAEKPFTTTIEVTDPFSTESPGYGYGWSTYPRTTAFGFKWTISTNSVPVTIQRLKANDTYGD